MEQQKRKNHPEQEGLQRCIEMAESLTILAAERAEIVAPGRIDITPSMKIESSQSLPQIPEY